MKCERCHEKEATKALSVTIDGQPSTLFVCDDCAAKEPNAKPVRPAKSDGGPEGEDGEKATGNGPSLADILMDMAKLVGAAQKDGKPPIFEVHVQDGEGHVIHHVSSSDGTPEENADAKPAEPPVCPACHMTLDTLRDRRLFGCPKCYETFRDEVLAFTRELQYDDSHVGKVPAAIARAEKIRSLRKRLRRAMTRQRYEEASKLTAEIRSLGGSPDDPDGEESHGASR